MKFFKKNKNRIFLNLVRYGVLVFFGFILLTNVSFAVCPDGSDSNPCPDGSDGGGTVINTKINNPLGENGPSDIPEFIAKMLEIVMIIGVPIIALAIIYTGFLFVSAQGNSEALTKAKKSLLYTLIGAALLLGAFVLAEAIGKTVDEIKSTT